jgi:ATP-dependent Clp protease adapter protein ClpS
MLVFSQNLSHSLSRAIAQAEQQGYSCATPEHVLLALIEDPDATPVLQACHVDLEKLRGAVEASMPHWPYEQDLDEPDDVLDSDEPDDALDEDERIPVQHFQVVLERAIAHAKSSGCEEVNSADVLVALLERAVGDILNAHGLTRYDATTFVSHGISKDAQTLPRRDDVGDVTGSFKVQLLNDDYTPMDFVVHVLEEILELEPEEAERMMLEIHHQGTAACGSFSRQEADERVARIMDLARQHQHPLRCGVQR